MYLGWHSDYWLCSGIRQRTLILLSDFFSDAFCLQEMQQVVLATGFGIRPRHIKSAEGMRPNHRASALAIEIQIPYVKHFRRFFELR